MAIIVNYENLKNTAADFRVKKDAINTSVEEIAKQMENLKNLTSTEVLPALQAKFTTFKEGPLVNCTNLIENFAKHLEKAAQLYQAQDTTLAENVSQIGNQAAFK